ncbi:MAG: diacylglycerol/polyprenol kinase family protein [Candidatus Hydrothermarchaeales archaeon]
MNSLETKRQLIHASGALLSFYIIWVGWLPSTVAICAMLIATVLIAEGHKRGRRLPLLSTLIDSTERPEVIEESPAKGAIRFFIGALASLLIFGLIDLNVASASIIILALGDSASTLVGKNFGRHKILYNREKSWEGTIAGLVFALIGAQVFVKLPIAIAGAIAAMLIESVPLKIDDNITIPTFSGLMMSLALYLL